MTFCKVIIVNLFKPITVIAYMKNINIPFIRMPCFVVVNQILYTVFYSI